MTMANAKEASTAGQIAGEAERILSNVVETRYQHTTDIQPDTGIYYCDCSGYVSYVLQQIAPKHLQAIPKESNWDRPRAFKYYQYFASLASNASGGWHPIHHLMDSLPGDILAWEETTVDPPPPNMDTGHVLILAEEPKLLDNGVMSVAVYDSSDVLHFEDSRDQDGEFESGVGAGVLRFKTDSTGHPTAVQFNAQRSFHNHPIAIGRCEKLSNFAKH